MIAIELEAPIVAHRLELTSDELPEHVERARVIVLYDEPVRLLYGDEQIESILERTRGAWGHKSIEEIDGEIAALREEWTREWDRDE